MSFKAIFKVSGEEFNVLSCSYGLLQEVDPTGRPSSVTRGGKITLTVESTANTSLAEWMCNNFEMKDGSVVFYKRDTDAKAKELNFKNGYAVKYVESFDADGKNPMTETLTISAREIGIGNGEHRNEWV
ncbi:type VI secretion system tube protein TssD [Aquimarina aquimarini]|uniref:type VI secretion system tube protein TssD n=1 Tax=Aquimarina aquimarini TaxID=1191734 RepID=UPI000D54B588|nr:type VI secretion system tube protein TssD [Aquimarina aquimarini]